MSRERWTIAKQIELLKSGFPKREPGTNFAYGNERDKRGTWRDTTLWLVCASSSGRFTVHPVVFAKPDYDFGQWCAFMAADAPEIVAERVLPALNRATGEDWKVLRSVCWVRGERSRAVYQTSQLAERVRKRQARHEEARGR